MKSALREKLIAEGHIVPRAEREKRETEERAARMRAEHEARVRTLVARDERAVRDTHSQYEARARIKRTLQR